MEFLHQVFEQFTIFGLINGRQLSAQQFNAQFIQNASIAKFHR